MKSALAGLVFIGLAGGTLLGAVVFAAASVSNYPGGVALTSLHAQEPAAPPLSVHIGNLAAMSGVSRFLEAHETWSYSKEEHLKPEDLRERGFDRLLTEWPEVPGFTCQAMVMGFKKLSLRKDGSFPLAIEKEPKVFVLARSSDGATAACGEGSPMWQ